MVFDSLQPVCLIRMHENGQGMTKGLLVVVSFVYSRMLCFECALLEIGMSTFSLQR
jgi:hypothetical protein